jgi:predicted GTPase
MQFSVCIHTMEPEEDSPIARSPQMGSRLSSIIEQWQKRQATETTPPVPKEAPRKRSLVQDVVVAVMGVTGAGKSSFIRRVTEDDRVEVGAGLQSSSFLESHTEV